MCDLDAYKHTHTCVYVRMYLLYVYVQAETILCSKSFRVHVQN